MEISCRHFDESYEQVIELNVKHRSVVNSTIKEKICGEPKSLVYEQT